MQKYLYLILITIVLWTCSKEFQIPDYIMDEYVDCDTHELHARTHGTGSNTVIFENGLGTNMLVWIESEILQEIGDLTQAIAYDRAGTKQSTVGPDPRDIPTLIQDLDILVDSLAENERVILVGHSLGGAIIRAYAVNYPEKVKGLVLVESSHEDFLRLTPDDERGLISEIKKKDASRLGTIQEADQLIENSEYLDTLANIPDIPVRALVSTKLEEGLSQFYIDQWVATQEKLGEGVSDFEIITTDKSGHNIHTDEPDLVIKTIKEIMGL